MKTDYGKMIIGVIIGIMTALTLTLNIWGAEWYKIVVSTIAGVVIGLFISDFRTTVAILKTGMQTAINDSWQRAKMIRDGKISEEQQHMYNISIIKSLYILLTGTLAILMFGVPIVIVYKFDLLKTESAMYVLLIIATSFLLIKIYIMIIGSLEFDNWAKKLNSFQVEKIWNKKGVLGKNYLTYDYEKSVIMGFEELTANMSFKEIKNRALMSSKELMKRDINNDWNDIKELFRATTVIGLAIVLFITTSLPVLPFWIIKQINKHGHLLNVAASIAIGSLVGTLTHSQLIGVSSGLGFLIISCITERLLKTVDPLYLFREDRLFERIANNLVK